LIPQNPTRSDQKTSTRGRRTLDIVRLWLDRTTNARHLRSTLDLTTG
jgi:hypothetical protein